MYSDESSDSLGSRKIDNDNNVDSNRNCNSGINNDNGINTYLNSDTGNSDYDNIHNKNCNSDCSELDSHDNADTIDLDNNHDDHTAVDMDTASYVDDNSNTLVDAADKSDRVEIVSDTNSDAAHAAFYRSLSNNSNRSIAKPDTVSPVKTNNSSFGKSPLLGGGVRARLSESQSDYNSRNVVINPLQPSQGRYTNGIALQEEFNNNNKLSSFFIRDFARPLHSLLASNSVIEMSDYHRSINDQGQHNHFYSIHIHQQPQNRNDHKPPRHNPLSDNGSIENPLSSTVNSDKAVHDRWVRRRSRKNSNKWKLLASEYNSSNNCTDDEDLYDSSDAWDASSSDDEEKARLTRRRREKRSSSRRRRKDLKNYEYIDNGFYEDTLPAPPPPPLTTGPPPPYGSQSLPPPPRNFKAPVIDRSSVNRPPPYHDTPPIPPYRDVPPPPPPPPLPPRLNSNSPASGAQNASATNDDSAVTRIESRRSRRLTGRARAELIKELRKIRYSVDPRDDNALLKFLLSERVYGFPGSCGGVFTNYIQYVFAFHPVISIVMMNKRHPFKRRAGVVFMCSLAFAITATFVLIRTSLIPYLYTCRAGCNAVSNADEQYGIDYGSGLPAFGFGTISRIIDVENEADDLTGSTCVGGYNDGLDAEEYNTYCRNYQPWMLSAVCGFIITVYESILRMVATCGCIHGDGCCSNSCIGAGIRGAAMCASERLIIGFSCFSAIQFGVVFYFCWQYNIEYDVLLTLLLSELWSFAHWFFWSFPYFVARYWSDKKRFYRELVFEIEQQQRRNRRFSRFQSRGRIRF